MLLPNPHTGPDIWADDKVGGGMFGFVRGLAVLKPLTVPQIA